MPTNKVKVKQASGKTLEVETNAGRRHVADNQQGFKDGDEYTAFNLNETVRIKINNKDVDPRKQHVPDGTVLTMHALDAAVLVKEGRGTIEK